MEGLLEGFSGGTGALPSACAWVSGMFEGESVSLVILLRAEPGAGRVGSGLDRDPARGRTWLQRGGLLHQLGLCVLYFGNLRIIRMLADVGIIWWGEASSRAGVRQCSRYFITKLILYCTLVSLLY